MHNSDPRESEYKESRTKYMECKREDKTKETRKSRERESI